MPRILVVDEESDICRLIQRNAEHDGYDTVGVSDGAAAAALCRREDFDLVMDIMMPDMDGYTACRKIRAYKDVPVLLLSARGEEVDKLFGFEVGADDCVAKPFSPRELMAHIHAILSRSRRTAPAEEKPAILRAAGLALDTLGRELFVDGVRTELTAREYDLLSYLVQNRGIVLTRENILNAVWGVDFFGEDRTVDWQIKLLRGKLGKYRDLVRTVRGVGYKFDA